MAGSISDALEIKLLDHVLKNDAFSVPGDIYIGLSTADPGENGATDTPPVGNGYARKVCNSWDGAGSRATANAIAVEFPEASGSWGTVSHFTIYDALSGGNFLAHSNVTVSKTIGAGDNASFAIGDIDVVFSPGGISTYLANELLDHIFKVGGGYSQPGQIWVALADTTIIDTTTGTTISEPGENYVRKQHEAYDAAASGASENDGAITFITADAAWGAVSDVALIDASSTGNILFYAALDAGKTIGNGDTAQFVDGALDFTMT